MNIVRKARNVWQKLGMCNEKLELSNQNLGMINKNLAVLEVSISKGFELWQNLVMYDKKLAEFIKS